MSRREIMNSNAVALNNPPRVMNDRARLGVCYAVEALASVAGNLMITGVFFYTEHRFNWGPKENFTLAVAQGIAYVAGALFASVIANALGRRRALIAIYLAMLAPALAGLIAQTQPIIIGAVLCYTFLCGAASVRSRLP